MGTERSDTSSGCIIVLDHSGDERPVALQHRPIITDGAAIQREFDRVTAARSTVSTLPTGHLQPASRRSEGGDRVGRDGSLTDPIEHKWEIRGRLLCDRPAGWRGHRPIQPPRGLSCRAAGRAESSRFDRGGCLPSASPSIRQPGRSLLDDAAVADLP